MAKIDRVEDLPEWYVLDKYRGCKSFRAAEWFQSLAIRADILRSLTPERGSKLSAEVARLLRPYLEKLRRFPLSAEPDGCTFWEHVSTFSPPPPVRPLRISDLARQAHMDRIDAEDELCDQQLPERWQGISGGGDWGDDDAPLLLEDRLMATEPSATLVVDLAANNSVLIAAFAEWLKRARAQHPPRTQKRERPGYKNWASYGLLPYLDLLIWAKETGNQIPHHVMAPAIGLRDTDDGRWSSVQSAAKAIRGNLPKLQAMAASEAPRSTRC